MALLAPSSACCAAKPLVTYGANDVQNEAAQSVTGTALAAAPAGDAVATGTRPNAIAAVSAATRVRTRTCMDASEGLGERGPAAYRAAVVASRSWTGRVRMAPLTWVAGAFRAEVLAARLESEGIDAQLRGSLDGAYGLTVGDMARVDVYVPEDQLVDAWYVLLADEVDATLAAPTDWWDAGPVPRVRHRRWLRWVAVALLAVAVLGTLLGSFRHW